MIDVYVADGRICIVWKSKMLKHTEKRLEKFVLLKPMNKNYGIVKSWGNYQIQYSRDRPRLDTGFSKNDVSNCLSFAIPHYYHVSVVGPPISLLSWRLFIRDAAGYENL